jgi:NADH-quinone oxidoreductase subunit L
VTTAGFVQACLVLGALVPLGSFAFLACFGRRLSRAGHGTTARHEAGAASPADGEAGASASGPGEPAAGWVATAAMACSLGLALLATIVWCWGDAESRAAWSAAAAGDGFRWLALGAATVHVGVKLDSLTVIMFLMVTLCATCIHAFSIGYMRGDARFSRFFAFLSLFCFCMLGLVLSSNLLVTFVFWELVGICSYLLIGFWFERRSASDAAIKAFVVNRVGDFGFTVGLGLCLAYLGTLSLDAAPAVFEAGAFQAGVLSSEPSHAAAQVPRDQRLRAAELFTTPLLGMTLATWLGLGLFCGAVGKSAQVPLHVWLPDAMEGPTPVSALIHAATMVAAGVYLLARVFLLLTPTAQGIIAAVGCLTLTLAALLAVVQTDIKRVLAYSTLSQLGYMVFGIGVGAWIGALFHLLTHAFFKALLFLGAGQVIAGCHHEQDLRRMGGLRTRMPITATTFLLAVLAISGVGIPWTQVGIGGFYSKDEILAGAYQRAVVWRETGGVSGAGAQPEGAGEAGRSHAHASGAPGAAVEPRPGGADQAYSAVLPLPYWMLLLPLLVAYVTPFYMGRCYLLAFGGRPRDAALHAHARESPTMYRPLVVLAGLTVLSGWVLFRGLVADAAPRGAALVPMLDGHELHAAHAWLPLWAGPAWIVGLGLAWLIYRDGPARAERLRRTAPLAFLYEALRNKLYFDHVYDALLVGAVKGGAVLCRVWDKWVIDGVVHTLAYLCERISRFAGIVLDGMGVDGLVDGVARLCQVLGAALRAAQTGVIRHYVLLAALGASGVIVSFWSLPAGVLLVTVGVGLLVGNFTLLAVLAVIGTVVLGWAANPWAAGSLLAAAILTLIVMGRGRSPHVEAVSEQADYA